MGDFIRLLFPIKTTSKYLQIYPIGFYIDFPTVIKARTPGSNSNLYSLVAVIV